MIKVIAIRENNGHEWESEFLTGLATAVEATSVIAGMIGQDNIIDGY